MSAIIQKILQDPHITKDKGMLIYKDVATANLVDAVVIFAQLLLSVLK